GYDLDTRILAGQRHLSAVRPSAHPISLNNRGYLCKAARLPLFWQFIGFGDPDDNEFAFLRKLDTLAVPARRIIDNAGFFHASRTPQAIPDHHLFDQLLQEFPDWLATACTAGIMR
ncbi:VWA domain-containing protein, partial [Streptomyces sp. NPDC001276]|uniref:VWA domain-containing protein n=1 Tax=Streptomyces sp. NPDC001276 TaxID=3364555 RepID=UPI0036954172